MKVDVLISFCSMLMYLDMCAFVSGSFCVFIGVAKSLFDDGADSDFRLSAIINDGHVHII